MEPSAPKTFVRSLRSDEVPADEITHRFSREFSLTRNWAGAAGLGDWFTNLESTFLPPTASGGSATGCYTGTGKANDSDTSNDDTVNDDITH